MTEYYYKMLGLFTFKILRSLKVILSIIIQKTKGPQINCGPFVKNMKLKLA